MLRQVTDEEIKRLRIKDMKGKWIKQNVEEDPKKGFMKMYVDEHYVD